MFAARSCPPSASSALLFAAVCALVGCGSSAGAGGGSVVLGDAESDVAVADSDDATGADAAATDAATGTDAAADAATDQPDALADANDVADTAGTDALGADATDDAAADALGDDVTAVVDAAGDAGPDAAPLCLDATSCDDGDACTTDTCTIAGCVHAAIANCTPGPVPCDAKTPCKSGLCDLASNTCVACLAAADCASAQSCSGHVCVASLTCATDVACKASQQVCEKTAGICVDCLTVDDCGTGQACVDHACVAATPCKSSKECTAVCDIAGGLCVDCLVDTDCLASQFCSGDHKCLTDVCTGPACGQGGTLFACNANGSAFAPGASCDDGNLCTADSCLANSGCVHLPGGATCTDGSVCTQGDACADGKCGAGSAISCDDQNPCTVDSCNPVSGCQHADGAEGTPCSDGNVCTFSDACLMGTCVGAAGKCDDSNACTDDSCNPAIGCVFLANAKPCDDNNPCTVEDICLSGACNAGKPTLCDDANSCTDNTCVPATGCVFLPNAVTCSDGNACSAIDTCGNGKCISGTGCNDGDPCTADTCDPAVGCSYAKNACDDGDACTVDSCDPKTGACSNTAAANCCSAGKVLYDRNFDDGATTSFVVSNSSGSATKGWQILANAKQAHSPKNALWYGDVAQGNYDIGGTFGQANSGTASIGPIAIPGTLPAGATLQVSTWVFLDVETCIDFDKFTISATNGAKTVQLWSKNDLPAGAAPSANCSAHVTLPTGWLQLKLDLPFAAGDFVTLKFAFDTVDNQYNATSGVFIDDLQILQQCK